MARTHFGNIDIRETASGDYRIEHPDGGWVEVGPDGIRTGAVDSNVVNDRVEVSPGDNVQSRINEAGEWGAVVFEPGTYKVADLAPQNGQTWLTGTGVRFQPDGDVAALRFDGVEDFAAPTALRLTDPDVVSSQPLFVMRDSRRNYFARLSVRDAHTGLRLEGPEGEDCMENVFDSIYMHEIRHDGMEVTGMTHDNHFNTIWIKGLSSSEHAIRWHTEGPEDGGNMIAQFIGISMGIDGFHIADLQRELWIGQAICDSNGEFGMNIFAGGNRATFIGSLWASGNGTSGFRISGAASTASVNSVQVSQVYATGNTNEGVMIEDTQGVQLGRVAARNNGDGLHLANGTSTEFFATHVETSGNNTGINGADAGSNCRIASYYAPDGTSNIANFETLEGAWS